MRPAVSYSTAVQVVTDFVAPSMLPVTVSASVWTRAWCFTRSRKPLPERNCGNVCSSTTWFVRTAVNVARSKTAA